MIKTNKSVNRISLDIDCTPFELFSSIPLSSGSILLESTMPSHELGKRSIIVTKPKSTLIFFDNSFIEIINNTVKKINTPTLEYIRQILDENKINYKDNTFCGGLVGYISYDLGCSFENVHLTKPKQTLLPEMFLGVYEWGLVFDHNIQKWEMIGICDLQPHVEFINDIHPKITQPYKSRFPKFQPNLDPDEQKLTSNFTYNEYLNSVVKAKEYILEGDIYQVNLTQQFSATVDTGPLDIYKRLRETNPAPFSAIIVVDDNNFILSSSPELFLYVNDKNVETRPIKGTIPRGKNRQEDERMKKLLLNSEKDFAELVMITDLERNDLNRVCETGSVLVPELKMLESYASVHHLVSRVIGKMKPEKDIIDLLQSTFPGGSITGAPKIRAMQIINELEPHRRGVYTGTIGYISFNYIAILNIAIRTLTYESGKITIGVGGGIVVDSIPEKEYEETLHKGTAIFKAFR